MIENDKTDRIRSIIGWMRKNITLSLDGYRPGWGKVSKNHLVDPGKGGH